MILVRRFVRFIKVTCFAVLLVTLVEFSDSTYIVVEGSGLARVLLLLRNPSSSNITFEVFNTNVTALGKLLI